MKYDDDSYLTGAGCSVVENDFAAGGTQSCPVWCCRFLPIVFTKRQMKRVRGAVACAIIVNCRWFFRKVDRVEVRYGLFQMQIEPRASCQLLIFVN